MGQGPATKVTHLVKLEIFILIWFKLEIYTWDPPHLLSVPRLYLFPPFHLK